MNQTDTKQFELNVLAGILFLLVALMFTCPTKENFSQRKCLSEYSTCATECLKEDDAKKKEDCYIKCNQERNECDLGDVSKPLFQGTMGTRVLDEEQASGAFNSEVKPESDLTEEEVCWGEKCIKKKKSTQVETGSINTNTVPSNQKQLNSDMREAETGNNSVNLAINNKLVKCEMKLDLIKEILIKN